MGIPRGLPLIIRHSGPSRLGDIVTREVGVKLGGKFLSLAELLAPGVDPFLVGSFGFGFVATVGPVDTREVPVVGSPILLLHHPQLFPNKGNAVLQTVAAPGGGLYNGM